MAHAVGTGHRQQPQGGSNRRTSIGSVGTGSAAPTLNLTQESFADKESFIRALGQQPVMQARFAQYLMQAPATRKLKGAQFVAGQGVTIFDLFDLLELQFYYREFIGLA